MRLARVYSSTGFTLVEMLIVMAILAILVGVGMPTFNDSMRDRRLGAVTSEYISAVYIARNESLTRRQQITLAPLAAGWQAGWTISDGVNVLHQYSNPDPDDTQIRFGTEGVQSLRFNANGRVTYNDDSTLANLSIIVCDSRDHERGRTLNLSAFGSVENIVHDDDVLCAEGGA